MGRCGPLKFIWEGSYLGIHTKVGLISATNKVLPMLTLEMIKEDVQDNEDDEKVQCKSAQVDLSESKSKQAKVDPEEMLQKVDLFGIPDWDSAVQQDAHNLINEYACIVSQNDRDLGKTSKVKHSIKLPDSTPFKECYQYLLPGMYEELKAHIEEMIDIGAIHPSNSPWASAVDLVWKKDRKLQFCIDLKRLNA